MAVAARFFVQSLTSFAYNPDQVQVKLQPVSRGGANAAWASATPSGSLEMMVGNPGASSWFRERMEAREEIAITFEVAPAAE